MDSLVWVMPGLRKLSDEQVAAIRQEYDPAIVSARELARKYRISQGYVYSLVLGRDRKSPTVTDDVGRACCPQCRQGMSQGDPVSSHDRPV